MTQQDYLSGVVGELGPWQVTISVLMALLKLPSGWFQFSIIILEADMEFWCSPPAALAHDWRNSSAPAAHLDARCKILDLNSTYLDSTSIDMNRSIATIDCERWEFSQEIFTSNIISEWDLVCDRRYLIDVTQATFMLGVLLGNVVFGTLADRFGRKKPLMATILLQSFAGVAASLVPCFTGFVFFRFLLALSAGGMLIITFVIVMEVVGESWRTTVAILYQLPFTVGICIMAAVSYVARDWRHFHLALSVLSAVYAAYWWFVPESPRWLLAVGRDKQAISILRQAARRNHRDASLVEEAVENHKRQQHITKKAVARTPTLIDLVKTPSLRRNTFILLFNWFAATLMVYTFTQGVNQIGGNLYLNIVLAGSVSVPGTLFCVYLMRFGRKKPIMAAMLLSGVASLLIIAFPRGQYANDWPRLALSGLVMIGMAVSFPALFLFTGELFPTVVRNVGVGSAAMCGRIGAIIAPFVKSLNAYGDDWTMVVVGVASVLCVVSLGFLPETQGRQLPDTLDDAETRDKRKKSEDRENSNYLPLSQVPVSADRTGGDP